MITKALIEELFEKHLKDTDEFLVDVIVKNNEAEVLLDTAEGITVARCAEISRMFRQEIDMLCDVYELNVSSPGLGAPLKVYKQFSKNIGREVEIVLEEEKSKPFKARLVDASEEHVRLEIKSSKKEGKKKVEQVSTENYLYKQFKTVKVVVSFK